MSRRTLSLTVAIASIVLATLPTARAADPSGFSAGMPSVPAGAGVPVGAMVMWPGSIPPNGWVEANGQSTNNYPRLARIYGPNLPDMRGVFPRGWDNGRGLDPNNTALLQYQADQLKSHTHSINDPGHTHGSRYIVTWSGNDFFGGDRTGGSSYWNTTAPATTGITINPTGGAETAPKFMAWMFIIKK